MQYRKQLILTIFILHSIIALTIYGQSSKYKIHGQLVDDKDLKIPYATICIYSAGSDSLIQASLSDTSGFFSLYYSKTGSYTIKIQSIGYKQSVISQEIKKGDKVINLGKVRLNTDEYEIKEVTVTGIQNPNLYQIDKMVYRPDSLALRKSVSCEDILQHVPKVHVSPKDKSVKVMGNPNVLVLVNGHISDQDINTIHASEVQSIEVITNPSAKYGSDIQNVLNIKLKELQKAGLKVVGNFEQSFRNELSFYNLSVGYNFKKVRILAKYGVNLQNLTYADSSFRKEYYDDLSSEYRYYPRDNQNFKMGYHTVSLGSEYKIGKHGIIGMHAKLNIQDAVSSRTDSLKMQFNSLPQSVSYLSDESNYDLSNQNYFLYFKNKSPNQKHELIASNNLYLFNRVFNNKLSYNIPIESLGTETIITNNNQVSNDTRLEYNYHFRKIDFESGFNFYNRYITNSFHTLDTTSEFDYHDQRNAIYSNFIYKQGNFHFQTGIRLETFSYKIGGISQNMIIHPLFSLAGSYKIADKQLLRFTYNRRLQYPGYKSLVPFSYYSADSLSVKMGNSHLYPQKKDKLELSYSIESDIIECAINASYSKYKDFISTEYILENNILSGKTQNFSSVSKTGCGMSITSYILFFELYLDGEIYYWSFPENFNNGLSHYLTAEFITYLPWDISMGLIFELFTNYRYLNGNMEIKNTLDYIYLSKPMLNNKAELSFSCMNPFLLEQSKATIHNSYFEDVTYENSKNIVFSFGFTYFFMKGRKIKPKSNYIHMEHNQEER